MMQSMSMMTNTGTYGRNHTWRLRAQIVAAGFLGMVTCGPVASASEPEQKPNARVITVSGTSVNGLFNADQPGPYNIVFNKLLDGFDGQVRLNIMPLLRAQRSFYGKVSECMFVGTKLETVHRGYGFEPEDILTSLPVKVTKIRVYSAAGTETVHSLLPLVDARVAADMSTGSNKKFVEAYLPPTTEVVLTNTPAQAFGLLDLGRVDHVMAFDLDVDILKSKDARYAQYVFDDDYAIVANEDVMQCHKRPDTERFITHINNRILSLSHTGELQALLDFE